MQAQRKLPTVFMQICEQTGFDVKWHSSISVQLESSSEKRETCSMIQLMHVRANLLMLVLIQDVTNFAGALILTSNFNAQLLTFGFGVTSFDFWAIFLIVSIRTVQLSIANMFLLDTNPVKARSERKNRLIPTSFGKSIDHLLEIRNVLWGWTGELAHFTMNRTVIFIFTTFAISQSITQPCFLHRKQNH